uniref:Fringe-like glycosyltransferase domain-containing protein n=1 Tax=Alexandrium monilatum TaxID=311494 RepID=A0A7S4PWH5_9DINO
MVRRQGSQASRRDPRSRAISGMPAARPPELLESMPVSFSASSVEEGAEATSRLHAASSAAERARHGGVLYVVYSDSRFYDTRLRWVLETWGGGLPTSALLVIGDAAAPASLGAHVHRTRCPPHSHEEGACCKYAEAVILARKLLQRDPSFSWAYFTDDDAYIRTDAMGRALARQPDADDGRGMVLGNFGCANETCVGGLCAGGGYAASAVALRRLVDGGDAGAFLAEQMQNCAKCGRWADLAMTQIFQARGIREEGLPGLNGWQLDKNCFDRSLESADGEPLMYHYVRSRAQMQFLYRLFAQHNETAAASLRDRDSTGRPWLDADTGLCAPATTSPQVPPSRATPAPGVAGTQWLLRTEPGERSRLRRGRPGGEARRPRRRAQAPRGA